VPIFIEEKNNTGLNTTFDNITLRLML